MMPTPLAPGLAGDALPQQSGRGHGRDARRHGSVLLVLVSVFAGVLLAVPAGALAQQAREPAPEQVAEMPEWRRTDAYVFRAIGDVTRRMQFVAQAMQLRDYCADRTVPDDFVRDRLQRFGRMTGRDETCTSLLDY